MGEDAELPGVSVCPKYLQEAVGNLLDNAIKYVVLGKGNGRGLNPHIRIRLSPNHEPYKAGVTILIEDNGPGISPEEKEAVFMRGYRGDATRLVSGSGIGLDISKSMLEQMGGILTIVDGDQSMAGTDQDMLNGTVMRIVLFRNP
jgi:signal transduction histidine kinase